MCTQLRQEQYCQSSCAFIRLDYMHVNPAVDSDSTRPFGSSSIVMHLSSHNDYTHVIQSSLLLLLRLLLLHHGTILVEELSVFRSEDLS